MKGSNLLYILRASTEQDLRSIYYTTVISQFLENMKGLAKEEFVTARKEKAERW